MLPPIEQVIPDAEEIDFGIPRVSVRGARGRLENHRILAVQTDPSVARGALGVAELTALQEAMAMARQEMLPLVLLIDSAGADVQQGVAIQSSFRRLIRDAVILHDSTLPVLAILGHNVFGGASMLAMCADTRLYGATTRLAMSGPRILQSHHPNPHRVAQILKREYRLRADPKGLAINSDIRSLRQIISCCIRGNSALPRAHHHQRKPRLASRRVLQQHTPRGVHLLCGGSQPPSAHDLNSLVHHISMLPTDQHCRLHCHWPSHSMKSADEVRLQSMLLIHLTLAIEHKIQQGARIDVILESDISGGLYIALAATSANLYLGLNGNVRTLHPHAVALITSEPLQADITPQQLFELGVVDHPVRFTEACR